MAYGLLKEKKGGTRFEVCSGGHPLPLLLRADGSVEQIGENGTLLGVYPDVRLEDYEVELEPGDAVVLYTDGLSEARGDEGFFGEERLRKTVASCAGLGASDMADRMESAVAKFSSGSPDDDTAILVFRKHP